VNKGKAFEVTNWTVGKHEHAMVKAVEATKDKKMSEMNKENELKYYIILETLQEIDSSVTIEDVKNYFTHPENIVEMFNSVYYAGKQEIYFHKALSPVKNKKKDTTKKN
jgi:hypothetical protein